MILNIRVPLPIAPAGTTAIRTAVIAATSKATAVIVMCSRVTMTMTWRVIVKHGGAVVVLPVVVIAVMGRRADMSCSRCEFLALLVLGMARITRAISYPPNQLAATFTALQ